MSKASVHKALTELLKVEEIKIEMHKIWALLKNGV